jgi:hypothetical protein
MDRGSTTITGFIFSRAGTWVALVAVAVLHALYAWWFSPSLVMHGLAVVVDIASLGIWCALALASPAFRTYVNRMPFEERAAALQKLLPGCAPKFRELTGECLALTGRIRSEFKSQDSDAEIGALIGNLRRLAEANRELLGRSRAFGTQAQKDDMQRLMRRQEESLATMLDHLKAFSGNLTLLEARTEQQALPVDDLRFINQGLEEAIKEFDK